MGDKPSFGRNVLSHPSFLSHTSMSMKDIPPIRNMLAWTKDTSDIFMIIVTDRATIKHRHASSGGELHGGTLKRKNWFTGGHPKIDTFTIYDVPFYALNERSNSSQGSPNGRNVSTLSRGSYVIHIFGYDHHGPNLLLHH